MQKRALRFIHFAKPLDHAILLFINTKILPINFLHHQLLAETMSDVSNNLVPTNIQELFLPLVLLVYIHTALGCQHLKTVI